MRARIAEDEERLSWRAYMAESLRLIPQNQCIRARWIDGILNTAPARDCADPMDIAGQVIQAVGIRFNDNSSDEVTPWTYSPL